MKKLLTELLREFLNSFYCQNHSGTCFRFLKREPHICDAKIKCTTRLKRRFTTVHLLVYGIRTCLPNEIINRYVKYSYRDDNETRKFK